MWTRLSLPRPERAEWGQAFLAVASAAGSRACFNLKAFGVVLRHSWPPSLFPSLGSSFPSSSCNDLIRLLNPASFFFFFLNVWSGASRPPWELSCCWRALPDLIRTSFAKGAGVQGSLRDSVYPEERTQLQGFGCGKCWALLLP